MNICIFRRIISILAIQLMLVAPILSQIEAGRSVTIAIMGVPVEEKSKIDANYPVSESGMINMPFIGQIRAAGRSPESLAAAIQNAYKGAQIYTDPTIQVFSTVAGSAVENQMVHLGGQVRRPGAYPFQNNLTIYQAIQLAGGATEFGSLKRAKLFRNGKTVTYDVTQDKNKNVALTPNDTIEVPQKNWLGQ